MRLIITNGLDDVLVDLETKSGELIIHKAGEGMESAVERWKLQGITEWVSTGEGRERHTHPRITEVTDENFLPRLRDYLGAQFNTFNYYLEDYS